MISVQDVLNTLNQRPSNVEESERLLNMLKVGAEAEKASAEIDKLEHEARRAEQEANKAAVDASLAKRQMRLQLISTLVAPLVPIAALLTVVATLYSSHQTLLEARRTEERKAVEAAKEKEQQEWESFASAFNDGGLERVLTRPSLILKLTRYSKMPEYRKQVALLSRSSFAAMKSSDTFKEAWSSIFGEVDDDNFDAVVFIAKSHRRTYEELVAECGKIDVPYDKLPEYKAYMLFRSVGPCVNALNRNAVLQAYASDPELAKKVVDLKDRTLSESIMVHLLSEAISVYLRSKANIGSGSKELDLSSITFNNANLDNVDFSKMRLSQTDIYISSVKGSLLTAPSERMTSYFRGTAWWEAGAIDQRTLGTLVANSYPGSAVQNINRSGQPADMFISEADYRKEIERLCTSKAPACSPACIKYGTEVPAKMPDTCSAQ
ncbi:hypothetical protein V1292_001260 [Bradyrhizobium sp. AZCC 1719]|uniref:hypothetical protein n=1 Tax=Bradyrhizobium sp. AZCC 1719 TaxID=3117028 RepID=UPI002FEF17AE